MILIIDGYNLLKSIFKIKTISKHDLSSYVLRLSTYAKAKKHSFFIVFDGGPHDQPVEQKTTQGVMVYVGRNQTADEYIERYSSLHKHLELLVVSSDRELQNAMKNINVATINSQDFNEYVNMFYLEKESLSVLKARSKAVKLQKYKCTTEIDALMEDVSVISIKKDDFLLSEMIKKPNKSKKKDRILLEKIKKL